MASEERNNIISSIHYNIGDIVEFKSMSPKRCIEKEYSTEDHFRVFFKNNKHSGLIEKVEKNHCKICTITPLSGIHCWIKKKEIIKISAKSY